MIIFNLLGGLAMASFSNFGAAFFQKAQLSGIISVIASLLLAVVAQVAHNAQTGSAAILSLLFPPMNYTYFIILMARFEQQDTGTSLTKIAPNSTYKLPGIVFWVFLIIQILGSQYLVHWSKGACTALLLRQDRKRSRILRRRYRYRDSAKNINRLCLRGCGPACGGSLSTMFLL